MIYSRKNIDAAIEKIISSPHTYESFCKFKNRIPYDKQSLIRSRYIKYFEGLRKAEEKIRINERSMTIAKLLEKLQSFDKNLLVKVQSKDSETDEYLIDIELDSNQITLIGGYIP